MKPGFVYIHGRGGRASEADFYKPLFPDCDVIGFDYHSETPWEAYSEFRVFFDSVCATHSSVSIIANSIGAYFSFIALADYKISRAYLISPIVNMEKLICDMMQWAGVSEAELKEKGTIDTEFGETLSWEYLSWVRAHPFCWQVPSSILYGKKDHMQALETVSAFADQIGADLTVMETGEHWFHTEEQMAFLSSWILSHNHSERSL
ncbi:MAG: alpha/beta hydrolase [Oscillospiraceae bacterium]|nr:alpha/beta hydrolase [Oscillospiraceae bacterium]